MHARQNSGSPVAYSIPIPSPQTQTFPLGESTWTTDLPQYWYDTI